MLPLSRRNEVGIIGGVNPFETILDFIDRGGFVMWPLILMSILTLSVVIERASFWIQLDSKRGRRRFDRLADAVRSGQQDRLSGFLEEDPSPYAELARRLPIDQGPVDDTEAALAAESIRPRLERGLLLLSTIVTAAPMLGILGTVVGIIQSFELLGGDATITDPSQVSGGIAEALISTATGLVVALVALFPYLLFSNRQDRAIGRLEVLGGLLIAASRRRGDS